MTKRILFKKTKKPNTSLQEKSENNIIEEKLKKSKVENSKGIKVKSGNSSSSKEIKNTVKLSFEDDPIDEFYDTDSN